MRQTHSLSHSATYKAWQNMKCRCDNQSASYYHRYGGRGITYDPRWKVFENFLTDMGEKPIGLTLDRKDNNGNYCKENCRWATPAQQAQNRETPKANTSGVRGVSKGRRYWQAYGYRNGKRYALYNGASFEKAVAARRAWEMV